jgi:hypothetical protein
VPTQKHCTAATESHGQNHKSWCLTCDTAALSTTPQLGHCHQDLWGTKCIHQSIKRQPVYQLNNLQLLHNTSASWLLNHEAATPGMQGTPSWTSTSSSAATGLRTDHIKASLGFSVTVLQVTSSTQLQHQPHLNNNSIPHSRRLHKQCP